MNQKATLYLKKLSTCIYVHVHVHVPIYLCHLLINAPMRVYMYTYAEFNYHHELFHFLHTHEKTKWRLEA